MENAKERWKKKKKRNWNIASAPTSVRPSPADRRERQTQEGGRKAPNGSLGLDGRPPSRGLSLEPYKRTAPAKEREGRRKKKILKVRGKIRQQHCTSTGRSLSLCCLRCTYSEEETFALGRSFVRSASVCHSKYSRADIEDPRSIST